MKKAKKKVYTYDSESVKLDRKVVDAVRDYKKINGGSIGGFFEDAALCALVKNGYDTNSKKPKKAK